MSISAPNHIQLAQLFEQMQTKDQGNRGSVISDGKGYRVIPVHKDQCKFLTLQEILTLTDSCKEELKTNPIQASLISKELLTMADNKAVKENKQSLLIKTALNLIQCVKNIFNGYGWTTTCGLARKLSRELDILSSNAGPTELDSDSPLPVITKNNEVKAVTEPLLAVNKKTMTTPFTLQSSETLPLSIPKKEPLSQIRLQRPPTLQRQMTLGKKGAIEAYQKSPETCSFFHKKILFQDINSYEALIQLVQDISGNSEARLCDPWSRTIILDALEAVKGEVSDQILEKILNDPNFTPALFQTILQQILDKAQESKPFSLFALEQLMRCYQERDWFSGSLPLSDPILLAGVQLLIRSKPNEKPTEKLLDWMMNNETFTFQVCVACITSYLKKVWEKDASLQGNLFYPLLDKLTAAFLNRKWSSLLDEVKNADVRGYLENR
jgi:hypothetical protein